MSATDLMSSSASVNEMTFSWVRQSSTYKDPFFGRDFSNRTMPAAPTAATRPSYVADVRDDDVLLGRGRSHARRPANVRFRAIIEKHREPYFAANSMQEKKEMTEHIVRHVGGRFLRSNQARTGWIEINGEAARVKVAQALQYRQRLLPKVETMDTIKSPVKQKPIDEARQKFFPNGVVKGEPGVIRPLQPRRLQHTSRHSESVGTPFVPSVQEPMIPEYVSQNDDLQQALETNPLHFVRRNQVLEELRSIEIDDDTAIGTIYIHPIEEDDATTNTNEHRHSRSSRYYHDDDDSCQHLTSFIHEMRRYSLLASVMSDQHPTDLPESSHRLFEQDQDTCATPLITSSELGGVNSSSHGVICEDKFATVSEGSSNRGGGDDDLYDTLAAAAFKSDLSTSMHSIRSIPYEGDDKARWSPLIHEEAIAVVPQHFVQFDTDSRMENVTTE